MSSSTTSNVVKTLNLMLTDEHFNHLSHINTNYDDDNYDTILQEVSDIRLEYDDEGFLIIPPNFPLEYIDKHSKGKSYKKSYDNRTHNYFLKRCLHLLRHPLKSKRLLQEVADEVNDNIHKHFRAISRDLATGHHTTSPSMTDDNHTAHSVYNLKYKNWRFAKSSLLLRHMHFALMVFESLFQYLCATTKTRKGAVNLRSFMFLLKSKLHIGLIMISCAQHNKKLTTILSTLSDLSMNHPPRNSRPTELGQSFLYVLYSHTSRDVYIGETENSLLRTEQHISQYIGGYSNRSQLVHRRWRSIKKMSIAFFPIDPSIREMQEKDIIKFFKPNLNVKYMENKLSSYLTDRVTSNQFRKLNRPLPIRYRSATGKRDQKFLNPPDHEQLLAFNRKPLSFPSKLKYSNLDKKSPTTTPDPHNTQMILKKKEELVRILVTPPKQLYRAARTTFHIINLDSTSMETFYSLKDMFDTLKKEQQMLSPQDVWVNPGNIEISKTERQSLDSLISCQNILGYTSSSHQQQHDEDDIPYRIYSLNKLIRCINSKLITRFSFEKFNYRTEYGTLSISEKIRKIGRHRTTAWQICRNMTPHQVRTLYYRAQFVLTNTTERGQARKTLSNVFERKFHIPITTTLHFSIPSFYKVQRKKILDYLQQFIEKHTNLPFETIQYLKEIVSVSFTRHDTILHSLSNNISFGKDWEHDREYPCACSIISKKYDIPLSDDGCIQLNTNQLPLSSPLYHLINTNARCKMMPSVSVFHDEWKSAMAKLKSGMKHISSSMHSSSEPPRLRSTRSSKKLLKSMYDDIINDLHEGHKEISSKFDIPNKEGITSFKQDVENHLVISELGKGKGILHLCCIKKHSEYTRSAFYENSDYFKKVPDITKEKIIKEMKKTYLSSKWDTIAPLYDKDKADVSYLYLQPKAKDFKKFRPLASYFHHLLKKVYRRASMGLTVILKGLSSESEHFNLFSTYETKDHLQKIFGKIKLYNELYDSPCVQVFSGDVQRLFTELEHSTIISALKWSLMKITQTKHGRGRNFVTLNLNDKKNHRIGPKYDDNGLVQISFEDIFNICLYDMKHVYFKISDSFILQIFGVPQGSPLSPPLATCVLIWIENQFMESIRDNSRFSRHIFMGIRYVDDIRIIVICPSNNPKDIEIADQLIRMYIESFPASLLIEPEPSNFNICRFLEGKIFFANLDIQCAHVAKNDTCYRHSPYEYNAGYPFQPFGKSYSNNPKQEVRNCINTRLHAINAYSMTPRAIYIALTSSLSDFAVSNFPKGLTSQSVSKFFTTKVSKEMGTEWQQIKHDYIYNYFVVTK